ncbi:MAG: DUF6265 family protein [Pseudomonadota bacterium]
MHAGLKSAVCLLAVGAHALSGGCSYHVPGDEPAIDTAQNEFRWLAGCWVTLSGETREVWSVAGDTLLFGYNTVGPQTAPHFYEQLRIQKANDDWLFSAYPEGAGPTQFPLADLTETSAVFVNPDHDYPQRITYARQELNLTATISKMDGSNQQSWTYVPCST